MSKLRDLIEKAKQEKQGGQEKPVLQSKAVEPQKTQPVQSGIQKPVGTGNATGSTNGDKQPTQNNSILGEKGPGEVTPPAGLSPLQLIQWRKQNAASQRTQTAVDNAAPKTVQQTTEKTQTIENSPSVSTQSSVGDNVQSASQQADAQKTNAGVADLTELKRNLEFLANNIEQKDLVGQVVRTIGMQLVKSPELTPQMSHADVDLIVRGLRRAYSIAARKKAEAKETKAAKTKDTSELAAAFASAGLNLFKS